MSPDFKRIINDLRLTNQFCDAKVILADGSEIFLHRNILSASSDYFLALFTSSLKAEDTENGKMITTYLSGVDKDAMNQIVNYMYTRNIDVTEDNVYDLYIICDYLGIKKAIQICVTFFIKHLNAINCIKIYDFACMYFCNTLAAEAKNFLLHNFSDVAQLNTDILDSSLEYVLSIISDEDLFVVKEEEVWEFVLKWVQHNVKFRKHVLSMLLKEIRLGVIDVEFFQNQVINHPLVEGSYSSTCAVENAKYFFEVFNNLMALNFEFVTPKLAKPRLPRDILFAIGGWNGGAPTRGIETYDSKADRWLVVHHEDTVSARAYHGSVFLDKKIYVIGGFEGREYYSSCRCFDTESQTWSYIAPMNVRRCYVSVAVLDGFIYAMGGFDGHNRQSSAEKYDPINNQWNLISAMNQARSDAEATVLDGKIYIAGGFTGQECLNTAEIYDPGLNVWSMLPPMLSRRSGVSCIAYHGCIYAIGGFNGINRLRSCEKYDPAADRWCSLPDMFTTRSNFAVEVLDDQIIVIGGFDGITTIPHVECYDSASNQWKQATDMNIPRSAVSAVVVPNSPHKAEYIYPRCIDLLEEKRLKILQLDYVRTLSDWDELTIDENNDIDGGIVDLF